MIEKGIAVAYERYSSLSQDAISIEIQREHIKEFANNNNLIIVNEYIDCAKTGTNAMREEFQRLMLDSAKGKFKYVLVYNISRFARNELDMFYYRKVLKDNGVELISVQEQFSDSPQGEMMFGLNTAVNAYYSRELQQKILNGNEKKKQMGKTLGHKRVGFIRKDDDSLEIDPVSGPLIREMFMHYAYDNFSIVNCVDFLDENGVRSINNNKLTHNGVHNILNNPIYNGQYFSKGKKYDVDIPKLIDDDTFLLVQNRLHENSVKRMQTRKKDVEEKYPLTSKLYCSNGDNMIGTLGTGKLGGKYRYYKCAHPKIEGSCKPIRKEKLEDAIKTNVLSLFTDIFVEEIANEVEKLSSNNPHEIELKSVQNQLKSVDKAISNLIDVIENGGSIPAVIQQLNDRQLEKEKLENRIRYLELQKPSISKEEVVDFLDQFINQNTFDDKTFSLIVDILINKITVDYDGKTLNLSITYNVEKSSNKNANFSHKEGSHNTLTGGDEGDRTPVQE